jgi:SAM-dependent methyltransferase
MSKILNFVKWSITLGNEPQNFLGAGWIPAFLQRVPDKSKRKWALRILNLSPHYFFDGDNPAYKGMKTDEYLETVFRINAESRRDIYQKVFAKHLEKEFTVLEYGCGPGFLAKAVSPHVKKIYACDISTGVIKCAEILNKGENIEYLVANNEGLSKIKDESLDAVISFAVIQHLTDEIFELVLENCRRKLKKDGKIIFHIQLNDDVWKPEAHWKADTSLKGKLKYKYGLHCFGRTKENHEEIISKHGFSVEEFESLKDLQNPNSSDADSQFLVVARKM